MTSLLKFGKYDTFNLIYLLNGKDHSFVSKIKFDLNILVFICIGILSFIVILWYIENKHYKMRYNIANIKLGIFYTLLLSIVGFFFVNIAIYRNYINVEDPLLNVIKANTGYEISDDFKTIPNWINDKIFIEETAKKLNMKPNELRLYIILKVLDKNNKEPEGSHEMIPSHPYMKPDKTNRFIEVKDNIPIEEI